MSRKQAALLAALAAAAALVAWLAVSSRQPPLLPVDDVHATFDDAETCLACHGKDAAMPVPPGHPFGHDCLRCHGHR